MSQSQHRQRLREQRQREAELESRVQNGGTEKPFTIPQPAPVAVVNPLPLSAVVGDVTLPSLMLGTPGVAPPIVPQSVEADFKTQGMTPSALRAHGKRTADILCQLPDEQYRSTLASLSQINPNLYGIVCDELNNIQAANGEDDGIDLSHIAGGQPNPNLPSATTLPPVT